MALVAVDGTPLVPFGAANRQGVPSLANVTATLIDAAKEACIMIGQIVTEDGGSHTIDTTGSSSLGWLSGTLTFANGGTTVKVGLATVDTTTGPPGRAVNVADVITFDVSKSLTGGGGGITASAWQEHVPDAGTKTIANGDLVAFCVQMTALGGADAIRPSTVAAVANPTTPYVTEYTGGTYIVANILMPNAVITFSDGKLGWFAGGYVALTGTTTQTWNNTSGTKEYGNFFQMPFPVKIYGLYWQVAVTGDTDFVLYSDPLGTPVAQKTTSIDLNTVASAAASRAGSVLFASPYTTTASQPLAAIIKPTSATNISALYKTFNASAHQKTEVFGTNGYAVNRNTGAFAAQNSNKDRFAIGLLIGAFDNGASAGGGAMGARIFTGM